MNEERKLTGIWFLFAKEIFLARVWSISVPTKTHPPFEPPTYKPGTFVTLNAI